MLMEKLKPLLLLLALHLYVQEALFILLIFPLSPSLLLRVDIQKPVVGNLQFRKCSMTSCAGLPNFFFNKFILQF
jgi:hypothetical protein